MQQESWKRPDFFPDETAALEALDSAVEAYDQGNGSWPRVPRW